MIPPNIISLGHQALINLFHEDIFLTASVSREVSPFYILELLNQIKEVLESYFEIFSSKILKEKITQVYLIIDEMFVNGIPILNWPSLVHQIIKPLSLADKIGKKIGIITNCELSATALLEPTVWRDESLVIKQNENQIVSAEIIGRVGANYYIVDNGICEPFRPSQ
ncbi:hypothetical protein MXB_1604 [Myxobolus squamalis]|nr:hypothetical protein MXB_1604 [Myxobolus squamalis]